MDCFLRWYSSICMYVLSWFSYESYAFEPFNLFKSCLKQIKIPQKYQSWTNFQYYQIYSIDLDALSAFKI